MATLDLTVDEVLTTTRTVRRRLDLERPVERAVVEECLRIAFQAPNGGNAQNWGWVVVDDPDLKQGMADIYRAGLADQPRLQPGQALNLSGYKMERGPGDVAAFAAHVERIPVLVVPAVASRYAGDTMFVRASQWGSLLPAVWSFMLALRSRGLGSAWTTLHLHRAEEMAALLGIPPNHIQAGLFPVAYTIGTNFKPANRSFSDTRIFWNGWQPETP